MADTITARATGNSYAPHTEGQHAMLCVDVIDLGEKLEQYQNNPPHVAQKCALIFASGEKNDHGELVTVNAEFTVSMGKKANLRRLLEDWRGKSYTEEQAQAGVPVHKLADQSALVTVEHKTSGAGNVYAKIRGIAPLPKGLIAPRITDYERAEYWNERKATYAAEVAKHRGTKSESFEDFPSALDDGDDDLPF